MSLQATYPLFLRLAGRDVLVVGGGPVACEKAAALHSAGARVHVVAPEISEHLSLHATASARRPFQPDDVDGMWLVVAAATPEVNAAAKAAGDARTTFVVSVDDVDNCSAIGAAQLHRAGLTLAISSDGRAPALVGLLRQALGELLPDDVDAWVDVAARARAHWKASGVPMTERRPLLLQALNALYGGTERRHDRGLA